MQLSPYLSFSGQCAEAFKFYQECLGGELNMHTHGDSPMKDEVPPGWGDKIMHARLAFDGNALMGCDAPPQYFAKPQGITVSLSLPDPAAAERVFKALADQGTISMPFGKTFWSAGFGMLTDRFGTPWMVNTEPPA